MTNEMVLQIGICPNCGEDYPDGAWPICQDSTGKHGHTLPHGGSLLTAIHTSERSTVYRNPKTGEIRYPARNDMPMPAQYRRQGYERQELVTAQDVRTLERTTGKLHERSHFDPGSGTAEKEMRQPEAPKASLEVKRKLAQALQQ